ncbi:Protein C47E12.7 [Aphelenchoides avenae]|nr:Protein C47E12.7 [Aphelenchus avenae]
MDAELESVEIVFAQNLASGEPVVRRRALTRLREHVKQQAGQDTFTEESLNRLCKGLHYALWMQDKMLLQEELADEIVRLTQLFPTDEKRFGFASVLLLTLSKEWTFIDRWRMDKFLMLIRRLVCVLFAHLRDHKWKADVARRFLSFLQETAISSNSKLCDSLKFHVASVYLDELDSAASGGLDEGTTLEFLQPYAEVLKEDITDYFFRSVCAEIFDTILHQFSEELAAKEEADDDEEPQHSKDDQPGLRFDYAKIAEMLFEAGKPITVNGKRRKRIYELSKKFEMASKGKDPFPVVEVKKKKLKVPKGLIAEAFDKMTSETSKWRKETEKYRKERKQVDSDKQDGSAPLPVKIESSNKFKKGQKKRAKKGKTIKKKSPGKKHVKGVAAGKVSKKTKKK